MNHQTFTPQQIANFKTYYKVQKVGRYNMFDPRARQLTGLSSEDYLFVMKNYGELETAAQSVAVGKRCAGFTLIELMVVVAIIGIMAAIAIPAYQDYAIRAKVTELVAAATACKVSVTEYYQAQSAFPPTQAAAGCSDQQTRYVSKLVVAPDTGVITVTALTGPQAIDPKAAGDYVLSPSATVNGQLEWKCNMAAGPTIPLKYLPPICRT